MRQFPYHLLTEFHVHGDVLKAIITKTSIRNLPIGCFCYINVRDNSHTWSDRHCGRTSQIFNLVISSVYYIMLTEA